MKGAWVIARRDLQSAFATPLAYLLICVFLGIASLAFAFFLFSFSDFSAALRSVATPGSSVVRLVSIDSAVVSQLTHVLAGLLVAFVPLLTMRSLAEEKRQGTMELLLTSPVEPSAVVLGKYLGALGIAAAALLMTLSLPLVLVTIAAPDPGPLLLGYAGLLLVASTFVAMGLLASALTESSVAAGFLGLALAIGSVLVGIVGNSLEINAAAALSWVSPLVHVDQLAAGVVDTSDLAYFVLSTAFLLFLTLRVAGIPSVASVTTRRSVRMGGLAAVYSLAALGALVALAALSARHPLRLDLTRNRHMSLTAESRRVVESIPADGPPVQVIVVTSFATAGGDPAQARRLVEPLLALFHRDAPTRIETRVVLAENDPALVQSLAIERFPTVVVRWTPPGSPADAKPRERRTDRLTQEGIAEAVQQVLAGGSGQAYMLWGHGEMQRGDTGPLGLGGAEAILAGLNLESHDLVLAGNADFPTDASLVVIAGPETDLQPDEIAALRRYAEAGGRLLVLHGPALQSGRFPALEGWLRDDWGIGVLDGVVADADAPLEGRQVVLLLEVDPSATQPIVRGFDKIVQFASTRKLAAEPSPPDGVTVTPLLSSGPRSWLETDLSTESPHYQETDLRGPHAVAFAATRKPPFQQKEARLVVLGSRLPASNLFVGQLGNSDFLRNVASWLTGREEDIAERSEGGEDGTVVITRSQGAIVLLTTLAVPLIVAVAGIATWWWRRKL